MGDDVFDEIATLVLTGKCTWPEASRRLRRAVFDDALSQAGGSVAEAARLLGVSHQSVSYYVRSRDR